MNKKRITITTDKKYCWVFSGTSRIKAFLHICKLLKREDINKIIIQKGITYINF